MNQAFVTGLISIVFLMGSGLARAASPVWITVLDNTGQLPSGSIDHRIEARFLSLPILGLRFYKVGGAGTYVTLDPHLGFGSTLQDHFSQPWTPTGYETDNYKLLSVDTGDRMTTIYIADDDDIVNPEGGSFIRQTQYAGTPAGLIASGYTTAFFWIDAGQASYGIGGDFNPIVYRLDILAVPPEPDPPTVNCAEPLVLECYNGAAIGTLEVEVQDTSGSTVQVVWAVDGTPIQTNEVPSAGSVTLTNLSMTASFASGEHVVEVTASNAGTNVARCLSTVQVRDTIPPVVICPGNGTVYMNVATGAVVLLHVQAIDNCGPAGVICAPPAGSVFPIGTTPVTCVATDGASNSTPCSFEITVWGPFTTKLAVLQEMEEAEAARGGEPLPALHKAILRLRRAVAAEHWLDETHLKKGEAETVFWNEAMTVHHLRNLLRLPGEPVADQTVQRWINRLVMVDRTLAVLQIDAAVEAGAGPKGIALASRKLARGDVAGNRQRPVQAILLYREAWRAAVRAKVRVQDP